MCGNRKQVGQQVAQTFYPEPSEGQSVGFQLILAGLAWSTLTDPND